MIWLSCHLIFMLQWKLTPSGGTATPNRVAENSEVCEPPDSKLKDVHKVIPKWVPYEPEKRFEEDLKETLARQAHSFAGKTEFPWLVDIRQVPTENFAAQEIWGNGLLMTGKYVMTTCDVIVTFRRSAGPGSSFDKDSGVKNFFLEKKDPELHRVMFASRFFYVVRNYENKDQVGMREIEAFIPHPKCNYFVLDYSLGLVQIKDQPIWPSPPWTVHVKLDLDCNAFQRLKTYFNSPARTQTRAEDYCYIGFWSRFIIRDSEIIPRVDHDRQRFYDQIRNHKVRYAVRWIDPKICAQNFEVFPVRFHSQEVDFMECMAINETEKVGVVCDHDRGAPIVCNGTVRALLLAGATKEYCRNLSPYPFLVIDARFMFSMWASMSALVVRKALPNPNPFGGASRHVPGSSIVFICILHTYLLVKVIY